MNFSIKKQHGVVLIVALVFLISLTGVASVLMLNTTSDVKMSGASEIRLIATQEAISAVDETIADQITGGNNLFAGRVFPQPVNSVSSVSVNDIQITNRASSNLVTPDCPHSRLPSSTRVIKCNILNVAVNNRYGNNDSSNVNVNSSIGQQVLEVGN